jgi:hypothetical protein
MCETGSIASLAFCPYEDVLCCGSAEGVGTLLVPGAGEPNFDSWVANPYQSIKERQQQEVAQLLDKLQPDTICLDPDAVGKVRGLPGEALLAAATGGGRSTPCTACQSRGQLTAWSAPAATAVTSLLYSLALPPAALCVWCSHLNQQVCVMLMTCNDGVQKNITHPAYVPGCVWLFAAAAA